MTILEQAVTKIDKVWGARYWSNYGKERIYNKNNGYAYIDAYGRVITAGRNSGCFRRAVEEAIETK